VAIQPLLTSVEHSDFIVLVPMVKVIVDELDQLKESKDKVVPVAGRLHPAALDRLFANRDNIEQEAANLTTASRGISPYGSRKLVTAPGRGNGWAGRARR
jgi:hypothetical protein